MVKLSVNINKLATLRNARGGAKPDLLRAAVDIQHYGAHGITVHPRQDERHIRKSDVYALKDLITTEFNIEGYPSADFLKILKDVRPTQATLVPDPPGVLTSNAGWDTAAHAAFLKKIISQIKDLGIRTSIFVDTNEKRIEYAKQTGTERIELYTEAYASTFPADPDKAISSYVKAAQKAISLGLGLNAGHDLDLQNLAFFKRNIPGLLEVSIGHGACERDLCRPDLFAWRGSCR